MTVEQAGGRHKADFVGWPRDSQSRGLGRGKTGHSTPSSLKRTGLDYDFVLRLRKRQFLTALAGHYE